MTIQQPTLSIKGALGLAYTMGCAVVTLITYTVWVPFENASKRPKRAYKYIIFSAWRVLLRRMTREQELWAMPTADSTYETWCKKHNVPPLSESLSDSTKGYWLGSTDADTIMLYFPGGGFAHPITPQHLSYLDSLLIHINAKYPVHTKPLLSILILPYSLAPEHPYPRQLIEATAFLHYVTSTLNLSPSRLLLAGDSAGGGLIFCLLSHLLHPHPSNDVPRPPRLSDPFRGVALLSPWVNLSTAADSMVQSARKDVVEAACLTRWGDAFLGGQERDAWNCPSMAKDGWWKQMKTVTSNVFIAVGGDEMMLDDIQAMMARLDSECGNLVQSVIVPDESHVSPLVEKMFLGYQDVVMDREVRGWLARLLW